MKGREENNSENLAFPLLLPISRKIYRKDHPQYKWMLPKAFLWVCWREIMFVGSIQGCAEGFAALNVLKISLLIWLRPGTTKKEEESFVNLRQRALSQVSKEKTKWLCPLDGHTENPISETKISINQSQLLYDIPPYLSAAEIVPGEANYHLLSPQRASLKQFDSIIQRLASIFLSLQVIISKFESSLSWNLEGMVRTKEESRNKILLL